MGGQVGAAVRVRAPPPHEAAGHITVVSFFITPRLAARTAGDVYPGRDELAAVLGQSVPAALTVPGKPACWSCWRRRLQGAGIRAGG